MLKVAASEILDEISEPPYLLQISSKLLTSLPKSWSQKESPRHFTQVRKKMKRPMTFTLGYSPDKLP
jgi:hypothetical protein